ncbi:MAG: tungstate ABC transporter substrate-binding protein WtpA [Methanoregula sp.]|nr:tungstate ABC transporter substrate-binding protein WtpA [Methanoregula sp.]
MALTSRTQLPFIAIPILVVIVLLFSAGCTSSPEKPTVATVTGERQNLTIVTTTSLYDTGLPEMIQQNYEKTNNVQIVIIPQDTLHAFTLAKQGKADILLVNSHPQELLFLEGGNGINRRTIAYNYYQIVGPANDPAHIRNLTPEIAFRKIRALGMNNTPGIVFVSRGDGAATHETEQKIWVNNQYNYPIDIQKSGNWYIEAKKGMEDTLLMANEKGAYTLTDERTYLANQGRLQLTPLVTRGPSLLNIVSVMTVYPANPDLQKIKAANNFVNFLIAPETMTAIGNYGRDTYGRSLFTPMSTGAPKGVTADFTTPATAIRPLVVFYAGSLFKPFNTLQKMYMTTHPDVDVIAIPQASGNIIDHVNKQNMKPSVIVVSDSDLIRKYLIPGNASWYANFAKNSVVICYTDKSRYAMEINRTNWYSVLARPEVSYAISNPDDDPTGYRSLMSIALAERDSNNPEIFESLIGSETGITAQHSNGITTIDVTKIVPVTKKPVIAVNRSDLIPRLKSGTVDYAFEYWSIARQNNLSFIDLPTKIDLSLASQNDVYRTVQVKRTSGTEVGTQIVYGITVPAMATQPGDGIAFVQLVLGNPGQTVLLDDGQTPIVPAEGYGTVPTELANLVVKK